MFTGRMTLIALVAAMCCTAASAVDCSVDIKSTPPVKLASCDTITDQVKSKEKVCETVIASANSAKVRELTGSVSAADLNPMAAARGGKRFISNYLNGCGNDDDTLMTYVTAVLMLAAPAAVFIFLNYICCVCCTCCHVCCNLPPCYNKCNFCKCVPRTTSHYSFCEKNCPVGGWLIVSLLMFIFAIVGIVNGVYAMQDSMVGGVCQIDNTYERFTDFLTKIKTPLVTLRTDFTKASTNLATAAKIDPALSQNVADISTLFETLATNAKAAKTAVESDQLISEAVKGQCATAWKAVADAATSAQKASVDSATSLKTTLEKVQTTLNDGIVGKSAEATKAIKDGEDALDAMQRQLDGIMNPRKMGGVNLISVAEEIRKNRDNGAFGFFAWVFIVLFFSVIGTVGMKLCTEEKMVDEGENRRNPNMEGDVNHLTFLGRCCARFSCCSWFLVLVFGISSAFFAFVFLPVAAMGNDVCEVLPTLPRDIGVWMGNGQLTKITDTCWNSTGNLFEGLDLDKSIDVSAINFDDFDTAFATPTIPTDGIDKLKEAIAKIPSMADPIDPLTGMQINCDCGIDMITGGTTCLNDGKHIAKLQGNADATKAQCNKAEKAFKDTPIVADIKKSGKDLVATIIKAIGGFTSATQCYFIACTWEETVEVICGGFIGSLGMLASMEMCLAICAFPFAVLVMVIMMRHGGHGPVKVDDASVKEGTEMTGVSSPDKYAVADPQVYNA